MTITEQRQATETTPDLAAEVVDALYPQWAVNGHDLSAAFAVVAEHHHHPVIRETAATTPQTAFLTETLEAVFWPLYREARAAQRA